MDKLIERGDMVPAAAATLLAIGLIVVGLNASASVFFYQMAACSLAVALALVVRARYERRVVEVERAQEYANDQIYANVAMRRAA